MRKWITIILIGIFIITGLFTKIYVTATEPVRAAEKKAADIALKEASLREIEKLQLFNGNETYYIVKGPNAKKENVIVWIPEKGGDPIVIKEKDGLNRQEAIQLLFQEREKMNPNQIISAKLAMVKDRPAWEIYYRSRSNLISYYYVDFETGEWLKKIENL